MPSNTNYKNNFDQLATKIKQIGQELGFDQIGITDINLTQEIVHLKTWIALGHHGDMKYFEKNLDIYEHLQKLHPNTTRVICCRINYPQSQSSNHPIASFAQLYDYSPLILRLLENYVNKITLKTKILQKTMVFAGNAPVLEKALAAKAGLGWYGKNSLLINENSGSFFFLGEILTDIPLPVDKPTINRCGNCFKCKDSCPTKAIVGPYKLDAKRCISYLTCVYKGIIPLELCSLIGTKIFGCDICQQVCPWNKHLNTNPNTLFTKIPHFTTENLIDWLLLDETEFKHKTKNSPVGRISYECWLRNIAIALGNSICNSKTLEALKSRLDYPSILVQKHIKQTLKLKGEQQKDS